MKEQMSYSNKLHHFGDDQFYQIQEFFIDLRLTLCVLYDNVK